jgi:Flp pilus assembly protein TadG
MLKIARAFRGFLKDRSGSMTVEFVVLVPVLLVALVFSFDFGRAFWAYDTITRDVRAGARYVSRVQTVPTSGDCPTATQNIIETGSPTDSTNKHFPWKGVTLTTVPQCTVSSAISGFNLPVQMVQIQASVPYTLSFVTFFNTFTGGSLGASYNFVVTDQARWIGN